MEQLLPICSITTDIGHGKRVAVALFSACCVLHLRHISLCTVCVYCPNCVLVLKLSEQYGRITAMTSQKQNPVELLADPTRVTVSVSQAAAILGVAKSTAHNTYKTSGFLCAGVPVLRVGKRCVVSVAHLRTALGLDDLVTA